MRFLLLQARNPGDPVREEEVHQFAARLELPASTLAPWDLLQGPPEESVLEDYDALLIGGSGEYDLSKQNLPRLGETLAFLQQVVKEGFPTFASCFGFQLLVAALGGEVIRDEENAELGAARVCLTEAGKKDELFGALPDCFWVQAGHKERASRMPAGALNLAYSEKPPTKRSGCRESRSGPPSSTPSSPRRTPTFASSATPRCTPRAFPTRRSEPGSNRAPRQTPFCGVFARF